MPKKKVNRARVYGLIDTRTGVLFYVGVTSKPLLHRLREHLNSSKGMCRVGYRHDRANYIKEIIESGFNVGIVLLEIVPLDEGGSRERFYYEKYVSIGIRLFQSPNYLNYENKVPNIRRSMDVVKPNHKVTCTYSTYPSIYEAAMRRAISEWVTVSERIHQFLNEYVEAEDDIKSAI